MSDKPISREFLSKAGERELEIFLLRDEARSELFKMHQQNMKEIVELEIQQQIRRDADLRQTKIDLLAERAALEFTPKEQAPRKPLKEAELQAVAEHRVDSNNAAERNALLYQQREREDAFLAQQKDERLVREALEVHERKHTPDLPALKRDFDRER